MVTTRRGTSSRRQAAPRGGPAWLERTLSDEPGVRLGVAAVLAFARIATDPTDAHLAALTLEHGATKATTDRDSQQSTEERVVDPLA
jgi:predicted nucleic acid-binding protein